MGVWIETTINLYVSAIDKVTPCMGVWIETCHPPGIRTLKNVTPCMGVWIETKAVSPRYGGLRSHTLYGCVD